MPLYILGNDIRAQYWERLEQRKKEEMVEKCVTAVDMRKVDNWELVDS